MLVLQERSVAGSIDPAALRGLGLSAREAEVLAWVALGKTNGEIAIIIGVSVRTVDKHVERVRDKLSVETRTAAAARALTWLEEKRARTSRWAS